MNLSRTALYARTLRNLRTTQILNRLTRRLRVITGDNRMAPPLRALLVRPDRPVARAQSMLAANEFQFLNAVRHVDNAKDWNNPQIPRLWLYNLHYFDDLMSAGAPERMGAHAALIARWISENPAGQGTGWEPYPLSLRIVNWVKKHIVHGQLPPAAIASLAVQGRSLQRQLEYHLLGNHLIANAKALVFLGIFFEGQEADRWLQRGLKILDAQLGEQILADGGHIERSPMYHALVTEDVLDLIWMGLRAPSALQGRLPLQQWREIAARMLGWLQVMTHPDRQIAFFNDAALGVAPSFDDLAIYARALGVPVPDGTSPAKITPLPQSGYARLQGDQAVIFFDAAELGPRYLLGHAHADTLSFEMSLFAKRLFVNSGVSQYEIGPQRERERGTAAHNTVSVDAKNSSEMWDSFRVARHARPRNRIFSENGDTLLIGAAHDGFRRQFDGPLHRRRVILSGKSLAVNDHLIGGGWKTARAFFHLAPGAAASVEPGGKAGQIKFGGKILRWTLTGGIATVEEGQYHPEFGQALRQQVIMGDFEGPELSFALTWS